MREYDTNAFPKPLRKACIRPQQSDSETLIVTMGGSLQGANSNLADVLSAPEPSLVVTRTVFAFEDEIASHSASALLPCALSSTPSATPCSSKDISDLLNTESGILTPPARAARKRENQPHELDLSTSFEESQQKDILQLSSEQLCEPKSIESQDETLDRRRRTKALKYLPSFVPQLLDPSQLLNASHLLLLRPFLPGSVQYCDWRLLFDTASCGFSLQAMVRMVRASQHCLMVIRDNNSSIFGAFLSEPLRVSEHAFYGTGECFVFSLSPRGVIYPWDAAMNDTCFIHLAVADGLTIGGGGGKRALWVDDSLDHGHSESSPTFSNEPLAGSLDFRVMDIEVWGFAS